MVDRTRNDLTIYDTVAADWWSDDIRWVRTLKNMVPARMSWFEKHTGWADKKVLDLGCAGGFMAEAIAEAGGIVTGIDPAEQAIEAAWERSRQTGQEIRYDVGVGESLPYETASFDLVVCVDVLEHVSDLNKVLAEVSRVLRPGGLFLFDTINRNPLATLAAITIAENVLGLLPKGTHAPDMFIKPNELSTALFAAGLVPGPQTGLGPRGINRYGDFVFGSVPAKTVIYMGLARKPEIAND
jgi:2-polyprenyl-6-hydroxyphenyl methylase/3-demethylubiquinone-9 3-methyltransferase